MATISVKSQLAVESGTFADKFVRLIDAKSAIRLQCSDEDQGVGPCKVNSLKALAYDDHFYVTNAIVFF